MGGGNFGLIYTEKTDFTPIYAKNYPPNIRFLLYLCSRKNKTAL